MQAKRPRFGSRHSGREFGRQIDADLTEAQGTDATMDGGTGDNARDPEPDPADLQFPEFAGAEFPETDPPDEAPPPVTKAVVRERAVRLLAIREHGRKELEQKLLQRELPPDLIVSVLDQLAVEGLQCDARFAESYTRMRVDRRYGPNKVRADLTARRLEQSVIEEAISDNGADWSDVAVAALSKKFGSVPVPNAKARAKMQRFLYQRGFAAEEIRSAMQDYEIADSEF